jgi:hypothetical protein
MIQELLDGVADAFRAMRKLPVWTKKEAATNVSIRDISRQSVSTSSLLNTLISAEVELESSKNSLLYHVSMIGSRPPERPPLTA